MRVSVSLRGTIKNQRIKIHKKNLWDACMQSLEGREVTITLEQYSAQRSLEQNKYLHAMFNQIMEFCGYTDMAETKFSIKMTLGYSYKDQNGFVQVARTHLMNKIELGEFIEKLRAWAHVNLNLYLMTPEEYKAIHNDKYFDQ